MRIKENPWVLLIVVILLIELLSAAGIFERIEMSVYDAWFRLSGSHSPGDDIVIVAMDDKSIRKLGPTPWSRDYHAQLIKKMKNAKTVALDMVFDGPTKPAEDKALADAAKEQGRVVLGIQFTFEKDAFGKYEQVLNAPEQEVKRIMDSAAGVGFINMPTDSDGVVRHAVLVDSNTFDDAIPSFALATYLVSSNKDVSDLELDMINAGSISAGKATIPIDENNQAMPGFWGPQGTFTTYSYIDVMNGKVPPEKFKDKIVLVGATSSIAKDYFSTPFTTSNLILSGNLPSPGVEIHASIIQSIINGRWYKRAIPFTNLIFVILAGVLAVLITRQSGPLKSLAKTTALFLVMLGLGFAAWRYMYLWLDTAAVLSTVVLGYVSTTGINFTQAEISRRQTRATFSRYVSPVVVDELMQDPGGVRLGGRKFHATVMFCDIRGFSKYSENKDPEHVVKRLNEYLSALTKIVFVHGGMLDKFLGDGLMAVFGVPVEYNDHVEHAINAAINAQIEVDRLNSIWEKQGEPPLRIGIGISSGHVVAGNIGSVDRMDFTVVGEEVNLAARMEGLTGALDVSITISERSVELLSAEFLKDKGLASISTSNKHWNLRYIDSFDVKGFTKPIGVYTVVESDEEP